MSDSVGRNSLIMASGTAASRITGQLRTILLAAAIGTTGLAANAYQAGSMIPQVIYTLVSGGIFNAVLVPHIVRTMKSKDAEEQLNKLVTFAVVLLLGVTLLMAVLAPLITRLYVAGSPELLSLTLAFTLWCTPQIFFYGLYTVLGQILAVKNRFAAYAWSSVGANVISCAGFVAFIVLFGDMSDSTLAQWDTGRIALTAGTWTLGVAFQALILFIPLLRSGVRFRFKWGVRGIGLRTMGPIAAWSLGIVAMDQVANIVTTRVLTSAPMKAQELGLAQQVAVAGNATYQNAYTIYILPYSLIAVSVATAIFPRISAAISEHDMAGARESLSSSLRNVGLIMFFFTAVFLAMPLLMVQGLLPTVDTAQATLIANTLTWLCLCLPMSSAYLIIQRTFYAFEDGRSPFVFMVILYALELAFIGIGTRFLQPVHWSELVGGSLSLAYAVSFVPLVVMLRRRFAGSLDGRRIGLAYGKAALAAVASAAVGLLMFRPVTGLCSFADGGSWLLGWIGDLLAAAILGVLMLVVYVGVLWLLRTQELMGMAAAVRARLRHAPAHADAAAGTPAGDAADELDDSTRVVPIISRVMPGEPLDELEQPGPGVPSGLQEQPIALGDEPGTLAARMSTEDAALPMPAMPRRQSTTSIMHHEPGELMRPHLGDTVLDRYTLVSPLREEAGLQAWKANDRVLARDCQLFIVNDRTVLSSTNAIAGTLAATRDPRFTPVMRLQHDGAVAVVVTSLDAGISLGDYLAADPSGAPLGHEAMRTVIAQAGQAILALQRDHLTHHAVSTDTVRLTKGGVQLADAPVSEALADTSNGLPTDTDERRAVRQLAAVLYCMLTRTRSTVRPQYSMDALPQDAPMEFRAIVKRGLELTDAQGPAIPLVTLAELEALLGVCRPLHALGRQELRLTNGENACSIVRAPMRATLPADVLPLPDSLASSQTMPALQFAPLAATAVDEDADDDADGDDDRTQAMDNKSFKALWNHSKAIMAEGGDADAAPEIMPEDATEMFTAFDPNHVTEPPVEHTRMTVPISVAGLQSASLGASVRQAEQAAAEAAGAGAGAGTGAGADGTGTAADATDAGMDDTAGVSATGRIPTLGADGHVLPLQTESQRALDQEREDIEATYVMGTPALPPSFAPQSPQVTRPDEPKAFDEGNARSKSRTRRVALVVCIVAVLAALGVAVHSIATTGSLFGFAKHDGSPWPTMNLDEVPFGTRTGEDVETPTQDPTQTPTPTPSKTTEKPENTTPYQIAAQNFLTNPGGQQGFAYALKLDKTENVSKVVITIRSSGGQGYLRANTTGDPNAGEQVAQFTFAEGGTTEIKLDKPVDTQDLLLWVPLDSLPGNQLYIQSVKVY